MARVTTMAPVTLEQSAAGPQMARLVIQPTQAVTEDAFILL